LTALAPAEQETPRKNLRVRVLLKLHLFFCGRHLKRETNLLNYTALKDKGRLEPWPPMEDLPFIDDTKGGPVHSGRFDVGGFGMRTMVGM